MTDRRQVEFETTGGWQPGPSGGERTLVGLAVVALLGGVLIVGGNLLPREEDVATVASATPHPSARPSRTQRPTPAPLDLVVEAGSPQPVDPFPTPFSGWIRARVDLDLRAFPRLDSPSIDVLAAGEVVFAFEDTSQLDDEGWLQINRGGRALWVATRQAGAEVADRYAQAPTVVAGSIWALTAGPDGFVGIGSSSGTSADWPPPIVISSADGARWQVATDDGGRGLYPVAAARAPAGWLLVSNDSEGRAWISSSPDGSHWTTRGTLRPPSGALYPAGLVGSAAGYLLSTDSYETFQQRTMFFSTNGVKWHEVDTGLSASLFEVAATSGGFYAWADPSCCQHEAAFSADGVTWSQVAGGPDGFGVQIAVIGDRWLAIETEQDTGVPRAWVGSVAGGQLTWQRMPRSLAPFANTAVVSLVSTGDEAIAFGWDRSTGAPLTWSSTGTSWFRSELPGDFGGIPHVAAAGRAGVAVVGFRASTLGDNPVVWHRTPNGAWLPEADPLIPPLAEPSSADCAPRPRDALAFVILDRATAALCYGDAPITFRAWGFRCDGCFGNGEGTYEPEWLAAPRDNSLALAPAELEDAPTQVVLSPALADAPAAEWSRTWLEVTGHFDDPMAEGCRYTPPAEELAYYPGVAWIVSYCRQQFVVTAVRVVDGP